MNCTTEDRAFFLSYGPWLVQATEAAAIAANEFRGRQNKNGCDGAAVTAMENVLNEAPFRATVISGEGEMDEAPLLYNGQKLGKGWETGTGDEVSIAVDPVEGTSLCANGRDGACSVIALSEKGGLQPFPDAYAYKLSVGQTGRGLIDMGLPIKVILTLLAKSLNRGTTELTVGILDRERHQKLVEEIATTGAKLTQVEAGDLMLAITAAIGGSNLHMVVGVGGGPEGILAAAALRGLNGDIEMRLPNDNDLTESERAAVPANLIRDMQEMGYEDPKKVLRISDLVPGKRAIFVGTGITHSSLLEGVRTFKGGHRATTITVASTLAGYRQVTFSDTIYGNDTVLFRRY